MSTRAAHDTIVAEIREKALAIRRIGGSGFVQLVVDFCSSAYGRSTSIITCDAALMDRNFVAELNVPSQTQAVYLSNMPRLQAIVANKNLCDSILAPSSFIVYVFYVTCVRN